MPQDEHDLSKNDMTHNKNQLAFHGEKTNLNNFFILLYDVNELN